MATLATDIPELVSYAEYFNAASDTYKIVVVYAPTPSEAAVRSLNPPDLVAGSGLNGVSVIRSFADSSSLLDVIAAEAFYADFLDLGRRGEDQPLLPLSFNIPLIVIASDDPEVPDGQSVLDVDALRKLSTDYLGDDRMGFSPRWYPDTAYLFARLFGVGFHQTQQAVPAWNEARLEETVRYLRDWSVEVNGGIDAEALFAERYLHDPPYKLVSEGRVRFAGLDLGTFITIPAEIAERLDFRWLGRDGVVPVRDDVAFIGRTRLGRNRRAARAFLEWLFRPETQEALLETQRYRRVRGFGFAGGFSALIEVNGDAFPRFYPFLAGRIPRENNLLFPKRLPADWPTIRREVLYPWLLEESGRERIEEPLSDRLMEWRRRRPG